MVTVFEKKYGMIQNNDNKTSLDHSYLSKILDYCNCLWYELEKSIPQIFKDENMTPKTSYNSLQIQRDRLGLRQLYE